MSKIEYAPVPPNNPLPEHRGLLEKNVHPSNPVQVIGWIIVGIAVLGVLFFVYMTQVYMPAHNLDRCAQGYTYAADGTLCP